MNHVFCCSNGLFLHLPGAENYLNATFVITVRVCASSVHTRSRCSLYSHSHCVGAAACGGPDPVEHLQPAHHVILQHGPHISVNHGLRSSTHCSSEEHLGRRGAHDDVLLLPPCQGGGHGGYDGAAVPGER